MLLRPRYPTEPHKASPKEHEGSVGRLLVDVEAGPEDSTGHIAWLAAKELNVNYHVIWIYSISKMVSELW